MTIAEKLAAIQAAQAETDTALASLSLKAQEQNDSLDALLAMYAAPAGGGLTSLLRR